MGVIMPGSGRVEPVQLLQRARLRAYGDIHSRQQRPRTEKNVKLSVLEASAD